MRPISVVVTSSNSPKLIPLSHRGGPLGVTATPAGAGNYTAQTTQSLIQRISSPETNANYIDIPDMVSATSAVTKEIGPVTGILVTLNSGTSVTFDIAQSDV